MKNGSRRTSPHEAASRRGAAIRRTRHSLSDKDGRSRSRKGGATKRAAPHTRGASSQRLDDSSSDSEGLEEASDIEDEFSGAEMDSSDNEDASEDESSKAIMLEHKSNCAIVRMGRQTQMEFVMTYFFQALLRRDSKCVIDTSSWLDEMGKQMARQAYERHLNSLRTVASQSASASWRPGIYETIAQCACIRVVRLPTDRPKPTDDECDHRCFACGMPEDQCAYAIDLCGPVLETKVFGENADTALSGYDLFVDQYNQIFEDSQKKTRSETSRNKLPHWDLGRWHVGETCLAKLVTVWRLHHDMMTWMFNTDLALRDRSNCIGKKTRDELVVKEWIESEAEVFVSEIEALECAVAAPVTSRDPPRVDIDASFWESVDDARGALEIDLAASGKGIKEIEHLLHARANDLVERPHKLAHLKCYIGRDHSYFSEVSDDESDEEHSESSEDYLPYECDRAFNDGDKDEDEDEDEEDCAPRHSKRSRRVLEDDDDDGGAHEHAEAGQEQGVAGEPPMEVEEVLDQIASDAYKFMGESPLDALRTMHGQACESGRYNEVRDLGHAIATLVGTTQALKNAARAGFEAGLVRGGAGSGEDALPSVRR